MSKLMINNTTGQAAWFSPNLSIATGHGSTGSPGAWFLSPGVSQCPPWNMTRADAEAMVAATGLPNANFSFQIVGTD